MRSLKSYTLFSSYFTASLAVMFFLVVASCVYPNRDVLRHFSRFIWVSRVWDLGRRGADKE